MNEQMNKVASMCENNERVKEKIKQIETENK